MQNDQHYLQNQVLNESRKQKYPVTVILVNGYRMSGKVLSFDRFTLLLEVKNKQNLIYKHAVSTIIPSENLELPSEQENSL